MSKKVKNTPSAEKPFRSITLRRLLGDKLSRHSTESATNNASDTEEIMPRVANPVIDFVDVTESETEEIIRPVQENNVVANDSDENGDLFSTRYRQAAIRRVHSDNVSPAQPNWNEQEELDGNQHVINMYEMFNRRRAIEIQNIPFVRVPINLPLPPNNNTCVVCKDLEKTHALIPCGHKSLCGNCVELLHPKRCPLCNKNFSSTLRIWS